MATYLITGANRGIGLALAQVLSARGDAVIGTARDVVSAPDVPGVEFVELDVSSFGSVQMLAEVVGGRAIDVLINNAAIFNDKASLEETHIDRFMESMRVNVAGPLAVTQAVLPRLEAGDRKLIVNISSVMGSIGGTKNGGSYGYRASKAALNMLTKTMSVELEPRGVAAVCVHPGWVETDMGGRGAHLKPEESAGHIVATTDGLTLSDSGRFMGYSGDDLGW